MRFRVDLGRSRRVLLAVGVVLALITAVIVVLQLRILDQHQDLGPGIVYTPVNIPQKKIPENTDSNYATNSSDSDAALIEQSASATTRGQQADSPTGKEPAEVEK